MSEADRAGEFSRLSFVVRVAVAVQEYDGHGANAGVVSVFQRRASAGGLEGNQDFPVGRNPLAHFRHPFVQQFRQHDLTGEQLGPVLITDTQGVAKALRDQ